VPKRLFWDNETGIGRGKLTERTASFAGTLGTEVKLVKSSDPESKGIVERRNRSFRSSFMLGRDFASLQDFKGTADGLVESVPYPASLAASSIMVSNTTGVSLPSRRCLRRR
jgi:hypothetical protein